MSGHKILPSEAMRIWNSSKRNIDIINRVYDHSRTQDIDNIVGYMVSMVKPEAFNEPKKNKKKLKFTDYEQRNYDFDSLEKKLLGWDQ